MPGAQAYQRKQDGLRRPVCSEIGVVVCGLDRRRVELIPNVADGQQMTWVLWIAHKLGAQAPHRSCNNTARLLRRKTPNIGPISP